MLVRDILIVSLCLTGAALAMDQPNAAQTLADCGQKHDVLLNKTISIEEEVAELSAMFGTMKTLLIEKHTALEAARKAHSEDPTDAKEIQVMALQNDLDAIRALLVEIQRENPALLG
ncbi:MAG: hypothetical protein QG604_508 [Candidatus Dependentiae bacterium]|nr:hypothetical protein [Candidatus Dependentiae bacterium]